MVKTHQEGMRRRLTKHRNIRRKERWIRIVVGTAVLLLGYMPRSHSGRRKWPMWSDCCSS